MKIEETKKVKNEKRVPLPKGLTEFNDWASDIIKTYQFPDNDSVRWTLATMIINLGPLDDAMPKEYFARAIRAAMAKQVAAAIFHDLKTKQMEAAAAAKKQAEATAQTVAVASNEPVQH